MPDSGYYEKRPRPESVNLLVERLSGMKVVEDVTKLDESTILVKRRGKSAIKAFLTNVYIISDAEAYDIMQSTREIDAIVSMSAWNQYTSSAKAACKLNNIGLFTFGEFMGAVYYEGREFLAYKAPTKDQRNSRRA